MTFNTAAVKDLLSAIVTDAMTLGIFETVNTHEPKNAPGNGLRCSIFVDSIKPVRTSGLNATSGLVSFFIRVYSSMLAEPQDDIDPVLLGAVSLLMESYSGDFQLASDTTAEIRHIDLLGAYGEGLSAQGGYLNLDSKMYRVMVISLPIVIDNLWLQEA